MENKIGHYRAVAQLGLPIVVGQLGTIVLGFADTLMVGHHSVEELAAASFVNTLFAIILILSLGFSYGLTPIIGSLYGQEKHGEIGRAMRCGMVANLLESVVLILPPTLLYFFIDRLGQPTELLPLMRPYLVVQIVSLPFVCWFNAFKQFFDAIGRTVLPMYVMVLGNLLNILGNYLLIYGACGFPELGLFGAGLSTLFSRFVMALILSLVFLRRPRFARYAADFLTASTPAKELRHIAALSTPIALQMGMESAAFALVAIMVGWLGTTALAAHQVVLTVSQLFFMVYYGLAAAVAVRVSHFSGQHDTAAMRATARAGFHLILLVAVIFSVPIFLLRGDIGAWFTEGEEVPALVAEALVVLIVYQFSDGLQCTYANALRGTGHVRPMMYIAFLSYFVISLPLSFFFAFPMDFGLVGIWMAYPVSLTAAGLLYYWHFRRAAR